VTVYDSDQFGSTSSAIANQGVIRFDFANNFTFSNTVSGAGNIEPRGAGILALAGANTFTGVLDIGSGEVLLDHNNALGQGSVLSNGGSIGLTSGVVLSSLRVDGAVSTSTAMTTTGNQTYNGALAFEFSGGVTFPTEANNVLVRTSNFESLEGNVTFKSTVSTPDALNNQRSLVVTASNGAITFGGQVGIDVTDYSAPQFRTILWNDYVNLENINPYILDVAAKNIYLNASVTTNKGQYYRGDSFLGGGEINGFNRIFLSLNPTIEFDTLSDTISPRHNFIARPLLPPVNDDVNTRELPNEPTFTIKGDFENQIPLGGFNLASGIQSKSDEIGTLMPNKNRWFGSSNINGSIRAQNDIVIKSNIIAFGEESKVIESVAGNVIFETGTDAGNRTPVIGTPPLVKISRNARFDNGTGSTNFSVSRPPLPSIDSQSGSTLAALIRSIELIQRRKIDLGDFVELKSIASDGAEVSIGALQDASSTPITGAEATGSGATQIDCSEQTVAMANAEQCRSTNQD
jgi:autotransporter-associated beta strand protein